MNTTLISLGFLLVCLPIIVVARLERRMAWPHGPLEEVRPLSDPTGYGDAWVAQAALTGFRLLGWTKDLREGIYQTSFAFLASPERDCVVIVSCGTILNMMSRGTLIFTPIGSGCMLYTTDQQDRVELDLTGEWRGQLRSSKSFAALLACHRQLLSDCGTVPELFTPGRELDEFRQYRIEHFQSVARRGYIAFDATGQHWHYTVWGAFRWTRRTLIIGFLRAITFGRVPRVA